MIKPPDPMIVLVIDNEPEIRLILREMLSSWGGSRYQIEEADSVATGVQKITELHPDVVLLDVELGDGTGFDVLKQIPHPTFQLIFTTAHNQYAVQAFKFSAIDYLLKPIDPAELSAGLARAQKNITNTTLKNQLAVLMQQFTPHRETDRQIVLKDMDKTYFIKMSEILYCEAEGAYTRFYLTNHETVFVSRNLHTYEELLAPAGFIRTHHSCLVNPSKIKIFDRKTDSGSLILESGHVIPVSQRKKDFILRLLESRT
ncbi:MAG: LytTR family DNA-binding domain-containing protein [Spirosomataceae bacterium]